MWEICCKLWGLQIAMKVQVIGSEENKIGQFINSGFFLTFSFKKFEF